MGRLHTVNSAALNLLGDAGDFGNLVGTAGTRAVVKQIAVWQDVGTTLVLDTLRFNRGTLGAGGLALTEYDMDPTDTAVLASSSLPTTDVGSPDFQILWPWNLLVGSIWLPTPDIELVLNDGDDLGIGRVGIVAHTGVFFSITWEEFSI